MKLLSFRKGDLHSFGRLVGDGIVDLSAMFAGEASGLRDLIGRGLLAEAARRSAGRAADVRLDTVEFLPVLPDADRVFGVGRNYRAHINEMSRAVPEAPRVFIKLMSALVGHGQHLVRPRVSQCLDYEGELALVMGSGGRYIDPADAMSHVCGYTIVNDGSVRDFQEMSISAGKNFPASGSIGPILATHDEIPDPRALTLVTRVNGEERQRGSTGDLIHDFATIISHISQWTELRPGDIISTGTPAGVGAARRPPGWLRPGDVVEVEIEPIGTLRNVVVDEADIPGE